MPMTRLSDAGKVILDRIAARTGQTHAEIIAEALELAAAMEPPGAAAVTPPDYQPPVLTTNGTSATAPSDTEALLKEAPWVVINHDDDCEYVGSICVEPCTCGAFERACIQAGERIGRLADAVRSLSQRLEEAEREAARLHDTAMDRYRRLVQRDAALEGLEARVEKAEATLSRVSAARAEIAKMPRYALVHDTCGDPNYMDQRPEGDWILREDSLAILDSALGPVALQTEPATPTRPHDTECPRLWGGECNCEARNGD